MYKQKKSSGRRSAFTLIEIMVAAVITIIMIGLVIQITSEVLKVWNRSMGKLSANAEARIAMQLLTSDLEAALLLGNGEQWLRVEHVNEEIGNPAIGQTVGLKLFAPISDNPDSEGNLCAVAYRLAFDQAYSGANNDTFVLFRDREGSRATFDELLGPSSDDRQKSLEEEPDFWEIANITDPDNYLAGNIVDFKIYIYGEEDGEQVILNDEDEDGEIDENYIYGGTDSSDETPLFAEIMLTVVSDEGMEILAVPNLSGTGFSSPEEVILRHGEVFKRRVHFQAKPL